MRRRWVRAMVWGLMGFGVLAIGFVGALRWTLIPLAVDEQVVDSGYQDGTSERMRTLNLESGRRVVVDRSLIYRAGDRDALRDVSLSKQRWERTVTIDGGEVELRLSSEFWRTMAALAFLVAVASWRRVHRRLTA